MSTKHLFTTQELYDLGFEWINDGGFYYLMLDNKEAHRIAVTMDQVEREEEGVHRVYRLGDTAYNHPLTRVEIVKLKIKGRASRFGRNTL